ncbi:MAG: InlB B-repeat-containing protein [Tannerella sp.]|nr:InlB B-repeat-containing protein [Tannerella sp.]
MKRKLLLSGFIVFCFCTLIHASFQINVGNGEKTGSYYTFPDLTVTSSNPTDKGYVVRIMFSRHASGNDAVTLPPKPGWNEHSESTKFSRVISIPAGATAAEMETYFRTVQISFDAGKAGQGILMLISENADDVNRKVFYSSDTGHWYEFVEEIKGPADANHPYGIPYEWWEAYNRALDTTFMGMHGYLAVITSAVEDAFVYSVSKNKTGWIGGTRGDIRTVLAPDGKHLTALPSFNYLNCKDRSGFYDFWYWACGPEWEATKNGAYPEGNPEGSSFYDFASTRLVVGSSVPIVYPYTGWHPNEPNNMIIDSTCNEHSAHGEPFLHIGIEKNSYWNDYSGFGYHPNGPMENYVKRTVQGAMVEYGGQINGSQDEGLIGFESRKDASVDGVSGNGTLALPVKTIHGDVIQYTITAVNASTSGTTVVVRDTLPGGLELEPGSISNNGLSYSLINGLEIVWTLDIPVENHTTVSYRAKPSAGSGGLMVNTAYVTSAGAEKKTNSVYHFNERCTVSFASGGYGTILNGSPQTVDYSGNPYTGVVPQPNSGYSFAGWSYPAYQSLRGTPQGTAQNIADYTQVNVMGDMTLTAYFKEDTFAIIYNLNSGTGGLPANPVEYTVNSPEITLTNPVRTGYVFDGWTPEGGVTKELLMKIPTGSTGNKQFTANWSLISAGTEYSISYDYAGGNPPGMANPSKYKSNETPFTIQYHPARAGYSFAGWKGSNGSTPELLVTVAAGTSGNLAYEAVWTPVVYSILYDYNGGLAPAVANPNSYIAPDLPLEIKNSPELAGSQFVGWTGSNGTAPQMQVQIAAGTTGNLNYRARWGFRFPVDTVRQCEAPAALESGHDGLSYQWILPDGSSRQSADITAEYSGRYILRTNYGSTVLSDTVFVLFTFEKNTGIKRVPPVISKPGSPQIFTVDMNPWLTGVGFEWSLEEGVPAVSTADTATVAYGSEGKKTVSVRVTASNGGTVCVKTFTYAFEIYPPLHGFFVDRNVAGGRHDGSSWENAFLTIQEALSKASRGDFIWVADGEYSPDYNLPYIMNYDSVAVYGGFAGGETLLSQRNFTEYPTILRGSGSSVIATSNVSAAARWDGFIVENGTAARGAGILNIKSSPTIANTVIRGNHAADKGGGIYTLMGSPVIYNVEISGNTAEKGAGMYNENAGPKLTNVTIGGNRSVTGGAGIDNEQSSPILLNTILWDNRAGSASSMSNDAQSTPYSASSLIQGSGGSAKWNTLFGLDGGGNRDASPAFRNSGFDSQGAMQKGNYSTGAGSPAFNTGSNTHIYFVRVEWNLNLLTLERSAPVMLPFDLASNDRIWGDIIDMGAYEYGASPAAVVMRDVTILSTEGIETVPAQGVHYITSQSNFNMTVKAKQGYSLENLTVKTGNPLRDKEGLVITKESDGSVIVSVVRVTESLTLSVEGVVPWIGSIGSVSDGRVWTHANTLYVKSDKAADVRVYTLSGLLYGEYKVSEGLTAIVLPQGFYAVFTGEKTYKVIIR